MKLKWTVRCLLIGALCWALLPWWGGWVFAVALAVLVVGTLKRRAEARRVMEEALPALEAQLTAPARDWARHNALLYVWPKTATAWAQAWQLNVLFAVLLAPWFLLRWLFLGESRDVWLLVPLVAVFVVAALVRLRLTPEKVNHEQFKKHKPSHDEVSAVLGMRTVVGRWPPKPSPEPDVEPSTLSTHQGGST